MNAKAWIQSKTMWFAAALTCLGVVQATFEKYPLEPAAQGMILTGIGIVIGVLRVVTNQPVVPPTKQTTP